mgnify:FL=1|jgi:Rod binding domain-containing protein
MKIDGELDRLAPNALIRIDTADGSGEKTKDLKRLEETAKQFEGLLLQQVFKQMKEATEQLESEEDDEGEAAVGEQYKSMFWTFLGQSVTEQGGFGMWESIYDQMAAQAAQTNDVKFSGLGERI